MKKVVSFKSKQNINVRFIKEVLYKKEQQESRFYWNRAHSYCWFASLKWFKVCKHHVFVINDDKMLSWLLNL